MSCCPDFEALLLERTSATLDRPAADRLQAHLVACSGCRAEAAALEEVLALVALPPPDQAELAALGGLTGSLQRERRLEGPGGRWALPGRAWPLTAAAAAVVLAASALLLGGPTGAPAASPDGETQEAWRVPDPDELLAAVDFEDDGAAAVGADEQALAEATAEDGVEQ